MMGRQQQSSASISWCPVHAPHQTWCISMGVTRRLISRGLSPVPNGGMVSKLVVEPIEGTEERPQVAVLRTPVN